MKRHPSARYNAYTPAAQLVWDDILDFLAYKVGREKMGSNTYPAVTLTGIHLWMCLLCIFI